MNFEVFNITLSQCDFILKTMYENRRIKKVWYAKDFQREPYFVGYEASARMSDLVRMYPDVFKIGKDGRFRTLELKRNQYNFVKKVLIENGALQSKKNNKLLTK